MNTQQMMYGNPYATGGMPYNPQMQQGQMNPQMMNQQMYMNMQNSYQVKIEIISFRFLSRIKAKFILITTVTSD